MRALAHEHNIIEFAYRLIVSGTLIGALAYGHGSAHAQAPKKPVDAPTATGTGNKPWNQGIDREVRRAAREQFREGNRLFRIPLFAQAAEQYKAALARWPHPAFYFNLAIAQLNLGQDLAARENLEQALQYGAEPLGKERYDEALAQKQELENQLGRIRVRCATPGAEVSLDGKSLFTAPGMREVWVQAETHQVTAKRAGYLPYEERIAVAPGRIQAVEFELRTLSDISDSSRRWAVWKPWAVVGAGLLVGGAGALFHSRASVAFDDYDERFVQLGCANRPSTSDAGCSDDSVPPDVRDILNRAERQQAIAVSTYIAGGAVIVASFGLMYLNRPQLSAESASSSQPEAVELRPSISPDQVSVTATIRY